MKKRVNEFIVYDPFYDEIIAWTNLYNIHVELKMALINMARTLWGYPEFVYLGEL